MPAVTPVDEMRRQLVFVYNADSGAWNALVDAAHKLVSPSTYACSLCALTYGAVAKKRAWADFVRSLPHDVRFVYRDQMPGDITPPALLEESREGMRVLLDHTAIDSCTSVAALIARVREVVA